MFRTVVLFVSVVLAGCSSAPKNITELKSMGFSETFTLNQNYQQTYRNIRNGFITCTGTESTWLSPGAVNSELYTDIEQGQITVNIVPVVGRQTPLTYIQIDKKNNDQSSVSIYYRWKSHLEKSDSPFYRWAKGDFSCK